MDNLLTVELSKQSGIQLLEREEIDRIYREQALAAENRNYLHLGQILGADGLLILEAHQETANPFLSVHLVAVKPGVLLIAERYGWPLSNEPQWAREIAGHLRDFWPRLAVPLRDAVPISIGGFRSALSVEEARELEFQSTLLTIDRLSKDPRLFVLERRQMESLSDESRFNGWDESSFWNGSYVLEGAIDRESYAENKMTLSAKLISPHRTNTREIELSGSRTNLAGLIDQLATNILAELKLATNPPPWEPTAEAEQFFSDAKWAYRWGLFSQCAAAAESAWALGRRNRETALLRIQAYAEDSGHFQPVRGRVIVSGHSQPVRGLVILAVPDPAKLRPLTRALELFCNDSEYGLSGQNTFDGEWYCNGTELLRGALATLQAFYYAAEQRRDGETQLSIVRSLARCVLSVLETNKPAWAGAGVPPVSLPRPGQENRECMQEFDFYQKAKWLQGGVLFENPEDAVPVFRHMIEQGHLPNTLPFFAGWTKPARQQLPKIKENFIRELCSVVDPQTHLAGLTLQLLATPFYPENTFHDREGALVSALWDNRCWILSQLDRVEFILQIEELLRKKYGGPVVGPLEAGPFPKMLQDLRREYLNTDTHHNTRILWELFSPTVCQNLSSAEAEALLPLLENYTKTFNYSGCELGLVRSKAGRGTVAKAPPKLDLPAEPTLEAPFVRWSPSSTEPQAAHPTNIRHMTTWGDKIWAMICYDWKMWSGEAPCYCASVDPATGRRDELRLPGLARNLASQFALQEGTLYVSASGHLEQHRPGSQSWAQIPFPLQHAVRILPLGRFLYLASPESLLELDPDTQSIQILASPRRNPPVNDLDRIWDAKAGATIFARADGTLGVLMVNRVFAFSPATRTWTEQRPIWSGPERLEVIPCASPGESQMIRRYELRKRQLLEVSRGSEPEVLLEEILSRPKTFSPVDSTAIQLQSHWDWPAGFDLEASLPIAVGSNLWILSPRKTWVSQFDSNERISFADNRQATLLCFEPEFRKPLSIAIHFESTSLGNEPFDPAINGFPGLIERRMFRSKDEGPFWMATPAGFVYAVPAIAGHWLIPKRELADRLASCRRELRRAAAVNASSSGTNAPTTLNEIPAIASPRKEHE